MFIKPTNALTALIQAQLKTVKKTQPEIKAQWLQTQDAVDLFYKKGVKNGAAIHTQVAKAAMGNGGCFEKRAAILGEGDSLSTPNTSDMSLTSLLSMREKEIT